jgi:N-acyl homoserine lactone hydrolase
MEKHMAITGPGPQRLYLMQVATMPREGTTLTLGCYFIQMSDGTNVLVDSGLPVKEVPLPAGSPPLTRGKNVMEQLAAIGRRPEDINLLICTHFDGDHAGNNAAFPNAQLVVQREHLDVARSGEPRFAPMRSQWDLPAERYRLVDGDLELLPGLDLIETSGHALGHQSVLVRLPHSGPVLLAIDAVAQQRDFTRDRVAAPRDTDPVKTVASTHKLLDLAEREHVTLTIFHHDGPQWQGLKKLPDYYD